MNCYDAMEESYKKGYAKGREEARKWIPVEERLPERGQDVIVFSGDYLEPKVFAYHFWGEKFNSWQGITHWMPMPEIPKREERSCANCANDGMDVPYCKECPASCFAFFREKV